MSDYSEPSDGTHHRLWMAPRARTDVSRCEHVPPDFGAAEGGEVVVHG
ncbi:hypothetical protein [Haloarcula laminariae]|nr:hypothetical protein [Halomicroarcula sp. FL173]